MMSSSLRVATPAPALVPSGPANADLGDRIRWLQAEARSLAREQVQSLGAKLTEIQHLAESIAEGGEIYPPGVRDLAGRLAEDSLARTMTLDAIMSRV